MKKVIALMLCLLMVMSMAACGSQSAATEESSAPTEQNEQNETVTPPTEETEQPEETSDPEETSEPEETQAPEPAFDTSWAGDEYVMPIPEPPFTEYNIGEYGCGYSFNDKDYFSYLVHVYDESGATVDYAAMSAYCEQVKEAGFTEIEIEFPASDEYEEISKYDGQLFAAYNADRYYVRVKIASGTPEVSIYFPEETVTENETTNETVTNGSVDIEALGYPALPDGNWSIEDDNSGKFKDRYKMEIDKIAYSVVTEYVKTLEAEGFECSPEHDSSKAEYEEWIFTRQSTKQRVEIYFSGDKSSNGSCRVFTESR